MRILFLTVFRIDSIASRGIYTDLLRKLRDESHELYIVSPAERRYGQATHCVVDDGVRLLRVRTLNIQKTNVLEKSLATMLIGRQYLRHIRRLWADVPFDLVVYSTPPITFAVVVTWVKAHCGARSYLLLKDIFPQNAVDLGMMRAGGALHRWCRTMEKQMYAVSDRIGCMSPANVAYVCRHNPEVDPAHVHVNPNSITPTTETWSDRDVQAVRRQHGIPPGVPTFVYGGNLGRPQGIAFFLDVLEVYRHRGDMFFVVVGNGTEYRRIRQWVDRRRPSNVLLLDECGELEYRRLLQACDVGLIFLDGRFTIPNFPSRMLSYMECRLPIVAATDPHTDLVRILGEEAIGLWSRSGDLEAIGRHLDRLRDDASLRESMGERGYRLLMSNYTSDTSYEVLMRSLTADGPRLASRSGTGTAR